MSVNFRQIRNLCLLQPTEEKKNSINVIKLLNIGDIFDVKSFKSKVKNV